MTFDNAQWIWLPGDPQEANTFGLFRRDVTLTEAPAEARLAITADARYWLWVNGVYVGQGPVRSWPQEWHYDVYDLAPYLAAGENTISVLAQHIGVGTFQYIAHRPGLLAELSWTEGGALRTIGTDGQWLVRVHDGYERNTHRINCQLSFVEHHDARNVPAGWPVGPLDGGWAGAVAIAPPEGGPWPHLRERDIPFLTEEPLFPARVHEPRLVTTDTTIWAVDMRRSFIGDRLDANPLHARGVLFTTVKLEAPARVSFSSRNSTMPYVPFRLAVDGKEIPPRGAVSWFERGDIIEADLPAGESLLAFIMDGFAFEWTLVIASSPAGLEPVLPADLPAGLGARFAFVGPFSAEELEAFEKAAKVGSWVALKQSGLTLQPVPTEREIPLDAAALVTAALPVPGTPVVSPPQGLATGAMEWTEIQPGPEGTSVELILEFEKLLTGWLEFELIAPEGAILDFYGFEAYQDGKIDYTWSMHNTMRYTARAGYQRYRSVVRRGLRYLILTCRGLTAPLKIRRVAGVLSTYPAPQVGEFRCSDPLLERVFEVSRWTTRTCMEDTFVDCPTYEQTFWVGDSRNAGAAALRAFGSDGLIKHCLRLAARSLDRSPIVESQVPSAWQNIHTCWSFLWALACEECFQYSGDFKFLRDVYPALVRQTRYCRDNLINERGLLFSAWDNLLEWAPMDIGGSGQATAVTHLNAFYVETCRRVAKLAECLGRSDEVEEFNAIAEKLTGAMNEWLWDDQREAYLDAIHADGRRSSVVSEQANTVCLLFNIAPPSRRGLIRRYVGDAPEGFVRAISPFMLFFTLETMDQMGDYGRMLERIRQTWGYMIERGSTTCWENMPGWEEVPRQTRSYSHAWSAAPAYFLPTSFLGVRSAGVGFESVKIAPHPVDLTWAEGRVPTPHGPVHVRWENAPRAFSIEVKLPEGVFGEIEFPVMATVFARLSHTGEGLEKFEQRSGHWHAVLKAGAKVSITVAK